MSPTIYAHAFYKAHVRAYCEQTSNSHVFNVLQYINYLALFFRMSSHLFCGNYDEILQRVSDTSNQYIYKLNLFAS